MLVFSFRLIQKRGLLERSKEEKKDNGIFSDSYKKRVILKRTKEEKRDKCFSSDPYKKSNITEE